MRTLAFALSAFVVCVLFGCSKPDESGGTGPASTAAGKSGREDRSGLAAQSADAGVDLGAAEDDAGVDATDDMTAPEGLSDGAPGVDASDDAPADEQPADERESKAPEVRRDEDGRGSWRGGEGGGRKQGGGGPGMGMGMGMGGPPSFEDMDTNKDGKITKEDLPEGFRDGPLWGDADGDGVVTRKEFEGQPRRGRMGQASFEDMDVNKDGKITKEDLPEWMQDMPLWGDTNKDGALSKQEWEARQARGGGPSFEDLDVNGDGKITKDDMPEQMRDFPLFGDANEDGVVTKEEFEAIPRGGGMGGMGGGKGPGMGGMGSGGGGGMGQMKAKAQMMQKGTMKKGR